MTKKVLFLPLLLLSFLSLWGQQTAVYTEANRAFKRGVTLYDQGILAKAKREFQKAIDYLSDFSSDDEVVSTMALGAIGDAYGELGKMSDATSYYQKAAANSQNEFTAPMFLMKAGMAAEANKDFKTAKNAYEQLKQKFPNSQQGRDAEKYLTRAEMQIK